MPTIVYGQIFILRGLKLLLLMLLNCLAWSTKYKELFIIMKYPLLTTPRWQVMVIWLCDFTIGDKFLGQTSFLSDINL